MSLGILLGTYMGGMCLGSLLLPRYVSAGKHPLRVYAIIEGGIGVCGLLVLLTLPLLDHLYATIGGSGLFGILMRALVAAVCLLPPTLLLGASLPAIARYVESSPRGVSRLGYFYGGNIAGAVCGCLFAGFYLLRVYDMPTATYVAVAINVAVAGSQLSPVDADPLRADSAPPIRPLVKRRRRPRRRAPFTLPSDCPG